MLATAYYQTLNETGLTSVARYARAGGAILCYHNIVPADCTDGAPGMHLEVTRFREQIDWLASRFTVIPLAEYARRLRLGRSLRRVVALTFDDGYRGVFDYAWPILRSHRLPATVFVPTGLAESQGFWWDAPQVVQCTTESERRRWLTEFNGDGARICQLIPGATRSVPPGLRLATWSRISAAVRDGCDVGVHTKTHRNLTMLSDADLHDELEGGRAAIAAFTGATATCFSYPYGMHDARVREAVARAGYATAVTMDFGLNAPGCDPLALRRINVPASISHLAFQAWLSGLRPPVGASV
jgi:peptidoglycan/xylan/chitin deacetylase (PgdA/CDA1 family)